VSLGAKVLASINDFIGSTLTNSGKKV